MKPPTFLIFYPMKSFDISIKFAALPKGQFSDSNEISKPFMRVKYYYYHYHYYCYLPLPEYFISIKLTGWLTIVKREIQMPEGEIHPLTSAFSRTVSEAWTHSHEKPSYLLVSRGFQPLSLRDPMLDSKTVLNALI